MKKVEKKEKSGKVPRLVLMPPNLDQWLEDEVAASGGVKTVAQQIREIVHEAKTRKQEQVA